MVRYTFLLFGLILTNSAFAQYPGGSVAFAPPAQAPGILPETVHPFNPQTLNLSWTDRRWQIVDSSTVIKDFGTREHEAREALRIIHDMGVNQYATIGTPNPVMEYWLIDGHAPQVLPRGSMRLMALDPARLRVEQLQGQWCLRDSARVLFAFGNQADEARLALAVIEKYGFSQVGSLGIGAPLMYVFFGRPDGNLTGLPASLRGNVSAGHLATTPFSRVAKNSDGTPHIERPTPDKAMEGVAPAVLPPLATGQATVPPAGGMPMRITLTGQPTPLWREQPHFGPRPTALVAGNAERVPFDWRQLQLRLDRGDWKLTSGGLLLGSFGANAQDARMALSAVRYYRFTEQWRPGGDASLPKYYLANPQAPRGLMIGLQGQSFVPKKVEVRANDGGYAIVEGNNLLLNFGPHQKEAEKLVEEIKHDEFDRLCKVGELGRESMTLFVRSR